mmetsp:Transcript_7972/g.13375  ORF Transcript_7972/g.13375 Transcript_7972/m.13375 type:complete len:319 (-) Transcript_7972:113-1069(-)
MVVPAAEAVEVEALAQAVVDVAEEAAHEGEVVGVDGNEGGDVELVLVVEVGLVLLVDQVDGLLLDGEVDDASELLAPDLLPLDVEEVLDVLERAFEPRELVLEHLELGLEGLHVAHHRLPREDEALVQHFGERLAQLLAQPVDQDLLGVDLDDAHERLVEDEHAFGEHRDLVGALGEDVAVLVAGEVLERLLEHLGLHLLDVHGEEHGDLLELLEDVGGDDAQRALNELDQLARVVLGHGAHVLRVVLDDALEGHVHDGGQLEEDGLEEEDGVGALADLGLDEGDEVLDGLPGVGEVGDGGDVDQHLLLDRHDAHHVH